MGTVTEPFRASVSSGVDISSVSVLSENEARKDTQWTPSKALKRKFYS